MIARWLTPEAPRPRIALPALVVGLIGAVVLVIGWLVDPAALLQSYLAAYTFWLGIGLGSLGIQMMQYLTGGIWGLVVRRLAEAGAGTLWLLALLFLPILLSLPELYPWARPALVSQDPGLQQKAIYLNVPFFVGRAVLYFACWLVLAYLMDRWSRAQDRTDNPRALIRPWRLSTIGLLVLSLTTTFAAIDWLMSLEPDWYSTAYGGMVALGMVLTAFAFEVLLVASLAGRPPLARVLSAGVLNDLGSLLLAFLMLWAYVAYFQYLLIWTGDLSEEIPWFLHRLDGGWVAVALVVAVGGFFVPFFVLVFRDLKRNARSLAAIAGVLLAMRLVTVFWLVEPAFQRPVVHWFDPIAVIALGGLWVAVFAWRLAARPLLPPHDPRLASSLEAAREGA